MTLSELERRDDEKGQILGESRIPFGLKRLNLVYGKTWGTGVFQGQPRPSPSRGRGATASSKLLGLPTYAHTVWETRDQIVHGDQTWWEDSFYRVDNAPSPATKNIEWMNEWIRLFANEGSTHKDKKVYKIDRGQNYTQKKTT